MTISLNGEPREIAAGTMLATVIATLTEATKGVAAALNETVVPRGQWPHTCVADGDRVEVLTAVQGG